MNHSTSNPNSGFRPIDYWRLWLFDAALVSAGMLFFLATQYGTYEFFGKALVMALLPLIAIMVLVGGAGSTLFALTKILIEKRSFNRIQSLGLLVGPGIGVTLVLVGLGVWHSPRHRLSFICHGSVPANVSRVRIAGYSAYLRAEWLAVFNVNTNSFQRWLAESKLEQTPEYDFSQTLKTSSLQGTKVYQCASRLKEIKCFRRVFKEREEHELGRIYAAFDAATSTAVVLREYHE